MNTKAQYQDKQSIFQILGCLLKRPDLLDDEKNYLVNDDFIERFHKIVFSAIQNLHSTGVEVIDFIAIDNYLNHFPQQYKNFEENNGLEYLQNALDLSEIDNFRYYYTRVKKFSLLRRLEDSGIDVSDLYKENMSVQELMSFDELSIDGILEEIEKKFILIKDQFLLNYGAYGQQAGKNIFKLIDELKQVPEIGSPLPGDIFNTITRGARLRKLYLYSAPTGLGKALANGTKVLTPNGYKNIESFSIGDEIFGEDGEIYYIQGVFPQGEKEIYEVEFSNESIVECCNEHLWTYRKNINSTNWETQSLQKIIDTELDFIQKKRNKRRLYLPNIVSTLNQNRFKNNIIIRDIRKTDRFADMTCISTTNPTELFILENGIVTHNTRYLAAAACGLGCGEMYDAQQRKWVKYGGKEPTLYITTELEIDEVQTLFLACLSGVNEQNILDGNYNAGEEDRVRYAAELIKNSPLWIEHLPNYNIQDIENTLRRYRISKNVRYCMFDYVHTTFKLLMEIGGSSNGMKLREDIILFILAMRLKDLCNELGMHISTATQVNADWENKANGNQNLLRGAKAIADLLNLKYCA